MSLDLHDPLNGSTLGTPNAITYGTGKVGQAAVFNGSTSYVDAALFNAEGRMRRRQSLIVSLVSYGATIVLALAAALIYGVK